MLATEGSPPEEAALALARIFRAAEKERLVHADRTLPEGASLALLRDLRSACAGRDELETRLRVDLRLGLPGDMLTKVDRASMAHGLEVRVPFLDPRVVDEALALPSAWKLHRGQSKRALREVFGSLLPPAILRRSKAGFDAPLTGWLRGPLRELARDTLSDAGLRRGALLDAGAVGRLLADHESGDADHAWRIWSLVVLTDWKTRNAIA